MPEIIFDSKRCTGCRACEGACKQEHDLPAGTRWRVVTYEQEGDYPLLRRTYKSKACKHCAKPKCKEACPVKAISKDSVSGLVEVDREKCMGCQACVEACPFGAMAFEAAKQKASKCNYCHERIKKGMEPACVNVCMGLALMWQD